MGKSKDFWVLVGCICAYNAANFSWWGQPEIVSALMTSAGLGAQQAGAVVSIELVTVAITAFVLAPMVPRMPVAPLCIGAGLIATAAHIVSGLVDGYPVLLAWRFIAGIPEGLLLAFANAVLANTKQPDRSYALLNTWNVAAGVLLILILLVIERQYGIRVVFITIGIASMTMIPLLRNLPFSKLVVTQPVMLPQRGLASVLSLSAMLVWGTASAIIWAYLVPVGVAAGLSERTAGSIAAAAALGGLLGGIAATRVGDSGRRSLLFVMGLVLHACILMVVTHWLDKWVFIILAPAGLVCVYFLLPLFLGTAAEIDRGGRLVAAMAGAFLLSGGTGPLVGGYIVEKIGIGGIGWAMVAGSAFAILCVSWLLLRVNKAAISPPPDFSEA